MWCKSEIDDFGLYVLMRWWYSIFVSVFVSLCVRVCLQHVKQSLSQLSTDNLLGWSRIWHHTISYTNWLWIKCTYAMCSTAATVMQACVAFIAIFARFYSANQKYALYRNFVWMGCTRCVRTLCQNVNANNIAYIRGRSGGAEKNREDIKNRSYICNDVILELKCFIVPHMTRTMLI